MRVTRAQVESFLKPWVDKRLTWGRDRLGSVYLERDGPPHIYAGVGDHRAIMGPFLEDDREWFPVSATKPPFRRVPWFPVPATKSPFRRVGAIYLSPTTWEETYGYTWPGVSWTIDETRHFATWEEMLDVLVVLDHHLMLQPQEAS